MGQMLENILTASFHGSIVIAVVLLLRLVLRKAPRKYVCWLWLLAGLRLLMPIPIKSELSLQPEIAPVQLPSVWTAVLPWLWLVIALCFGVYSFVSYLKLKRQVREAVRIRGGWESDRIDTAFILGFIKPRIYIPMGMDRENQKYILEHERTHLDKGDHWIKMIGFLALALHWFNPLVWIAYLCLCKDIEMACDERVVQFMELEERKGYSAALLSCSTNHAHFASPVAFGEISVKERVMTVLNYKKPGFWVSLLSLIAIAFVAVCLLTSPTAASPDANAQAPVAENTEPVSMEEEAYSKVTGEFERIMSMEYYAIGFAVVDDNGGVGWSVEFYKDGDNTLWRESNHADWDGCMHYEGKDYVLTEDDVWAEDAPLESQLEELLALFTLEGKELFNTAYESKINKRDDSPYEQMTFVAKWSPEEGKTNTQPMRFTFGLDGTMSSARVENVEWGNAENVMFFVITESREDVEKVFADAVANLMPENFEELVNARPSNYTEYDRDYQLGSARMGWHFLDSEWFFKFGAEDVTHTGVKLVVEDSLPWGENSLSGGQVTSAAEYYIERLEDGKWVDVPRITDDFVEIQTKKLGKGDTLTINWEGNYGALPGGFYRIGMYFDFAASSGETDTKLCYAKFRLYDPVDEELLALCEAGWEQLHTLTHFRLRKLHNIYELSDMQGYGPRYEVTQVWRSGENWLEASQLYVKETDKICTGGGSMMRDGDAYSLTWTDHDPEKPVAAWQSNTYMEDSNYWVLIHDLEWQDSLLESVTRSGNQITILQTSTYREDICQKELVYTFDDAGKLTGITQSYVHADGSRTVENELMVLDSTETEIEAFIGAQDVSKPGIFVLTQEKDTVGEKDTLKVGGFVNTRAVDTVNVETVQELAHREAPCYKDYTNDFSNVKEVFYDAEAKMWKVSCKFSHDGTIWYDVYINDQGITQLMITRVVEPEW